MRKTKMSLQCSGSKNRSILRVIDQTPMIIKRGLTVYFSKMRTFQAPVHPISSVKPSRVSRCQAERKNSETFLSPIFI